MSYTSQPPQSVKGYTLARPRITKSGYWAIAKYTIIPFLGALSALDLLIYLYFRYVLRSCYGIWCWF